MMEVYLLGFLRLTGIAAGSKAVFAAGDAARKGDQFRLETPQDALDEVVPDEFEMIYHATFEFVPNSLLVFFHGRVPQEKGLAPDVPMHVVRQAKIHALREGG